MARTRHYFGTDGIRGRVGEFPISVEFALKLGWAVGRVLTPRGGKALIAKDTRISGYMFESALEAGLSAAGVDVQLIGPLPTPGLAYLTRTLQADIGIMISASHNPHYDNGFKFFTHQGFKLADRVEFEIEDMLSDPLITIPSEKLGKASRLTDATSRYTQFCKNSVPNTVNLAGLKIVIDSANGAAYHIAPTVFQELGATVISIHDKPNGLNINENCGSLHPESVQQAVLAHKADVGIALDGDGDRLIMVDQTGEVLDGDELLYIIVQHRLAQGRLAGGVVGTLMSNMGLETAIRDLGLEFVRAKVGDRYVLEQLQKQDWIIGGENSGHIVLLDATTTGDGVIAALQVLYAMIDSQRTLQELKSGMQKYPQVIRNVAIKKEAAQVLTHSNVVKAIQNAEKKLGKTGRVLMRPSGTEPLIRVMVEGQDAEMISHLADELALVVSAAVES